MAIIDSISKIFGFGGATPANRKGAVLADDVHVQGGTHDSTHTKLELKNQPVEYLKNKPN